MCDLSVINTAKRVDFDPSLYKENRHRLIEAMNASLPKGQKAVAVLQGGHDVQRSNTDNEKLFRQESFFYWAFGCNLSECWGVFDFNNKKSYLVVPRLPAEYAIWMGRLKTCEEFQKEYDVDEVIFFEDMNPLLQKLDPEVVYVLSGLNSDSQLILPPPSAEFLKYYRLDTGKLHQVMVELRVHKTQKEIEMMRSINRIASEAHMAMMSAGKPGMVEDQFESTFKWWSHYYGGARFFAYTAISASGPNASVLHYGHSGAPNNRRTEDGDWLLADMGCETHGYASDITTTFPLNGTFSDKQKIIYNAVLAANVAVRKALKPGVYWPDLQTLAYQHILQHLTDAKLLKGNVDDMMKANLGAVFMPHGLGHLIGIDVHDVGGVPHGVSRSKLPGYKAVRLYRKLEPTMAVTVEPGCYFVDVLLDEAMADDHLSKFIDAERLKEFRGIGGVRLEDNIIITENGSDNLTCVPRTIEQVEACCRGELKTLDEVIDLCV